MGSLSPANVHGPGPDSEEIAFPRSPAEKTETDKRRRKCPISKSRKPAKLPRQCDIQPPSISSCLARLFCVSFVLPLKRRGGFLSNPQTRLQNAVFLPLVSYDGWAGESKQKARNM
jgi:hypothetical protein